MLSQWAAADGVIDKRLRLTVHPRFGAVRGQAPVPLKFTLSWSDPQLLEGHLHLKWFINRTHLGTSITPEAALSSGSVTRNVLLPPVIMPHEGDVFSVQGEFVTKDRIYDLDVHDVFVPLDWRRTLVVGIGREPPLKMEATAVDSQSIDAGMFTASLQLERFLNQPMSHRELSTQVVEVPPAQLPTNPLESMGFDVLVIPGENIDELTTACLKALTTWVEAGGSLCVLADSPVNQDFVDFLNRLTGDADIDAAYLRTPEGRLLPVQGELQGIDQHRCELGRLVVSRGSVDFASEDWQRAVLFLWKVRAVRIEEWERGAEWPVELPPDSYGYVRPLTFQPNREFAVPRMTELMLPQSIQGIPLVTICVLLGIFLLLIAPGDYFLLGWLKRRRWTWVLFPVLSLLFTAMMIKLAEAHLGSANLERSITFIDLAADGRALRSTRIELLYPAFSRQVIDESTSGWRVPVDPDTYQSNAFRGTAQVDLAYESAWVYAGSLPGRHVIQRDVRQWSPRLSRSTTLGSAPLEIETPFSGFDWSTVTWQHAMQPAELTSIRQALLTRDRSVDIVLIGNSLDAPLDENRPVRERILNFARFVTYTGDSHLFDIVSQVSPNGAGHWDDLAITDWSENELVFLAMTEASEGHYVVYRKLLTKEE